MISRLSINLHTRDLVRDGAAIGTIAADASARMLGAGDQRRALTRLR